jgi:hypothetical protein
LLLLLLPLMLLLLPLMLLPLLLLPLMLLLLPLLLLLWHHWRSCCWQTPNGANLGHCKPRVDHPIRPNSSSTSPTCPCCIGSTSPTCRGWCNRRPLGPGPLLLLVLPLGLQCPPLLLLLLLWGQPCAGRCSPGLVEQLLHCCLVRLQLLLSHHRCGDLLPQLRQHLVNKDLTMLAGVKHRRTALVVWLLPLALLLPLPLALLLRPLPL